MSEESKPRGRPSVYTPEIAEEICRRLADGESLNAICKTVDFPDESTVRKWALENYEGFYPKYAHAREIQAHKYAEDVITIADTAEDAALARLQVDARKWVCSKVLPKVYGDKLEQTLKGDPNAPLEHNVSVKFVD